jgi:hypothetical protein
MAKRPAPTDLAGRRLALGATVDTMANGLGLVPGDVIEIEQGQASDDRLNHYATWLKRMETWPEAKRVAEILAAGSDGRRFHP